MKEKVKSNAGFIFDLLKSAVLGVLVSVILILVLAFVLKFVDLSDGAITIINEIIKIISILFAVINLVKKSSSKIVLKAGLLGALYTLVTFLLFSALRGSYSFSLSLLVDMVLGGIVGVIIAVILNIFSKERITA